MGMCRSLAIACIFAVCVAVSRAQVALSPPTDPILFRFSGDGVFDGHYGPLHSVQVAATAALVRCGIKAKPFSDGVMDAEARDKFTALAKCPEFSTKLDPASQAFKGAVTERFWTLLTGASVPTALERARTVMLTFERTDYTSLEWNFCQSRPIYDPTKRDSKCYSNDPHSYATWGPNGATAGNGREIQIILQTIDMENAKLIPDSFGSEEAAVYRMLHVSGLKDTEIYSCGIWMDRNRRAEWKNGFERLGASPVARDIYDRVYRSVSFDGGKIDIFAKAYKDVGLTPSDVDFAFFKDRAAQTSVSSSALKAAMAGVAQTKVEHWKIRRAISLGLRVSGPERGPRLGRDVAFYVDGLGASKLTGEEMAAWQERGQIRVSDVGLTDGAVSIYAKSEPAIDGKVVDPVILTESERKVCPAAVLNTALPGLRKQTSGIR